MVALCGLFAPWSWGEGGGALNDEPAKLEVHEWGTFTMVSGTDGMPLSWYLPETRVTELPKFVNRNIQVATKTGSGTLTLTGRASGDRVRMETPVIYFYPEQPMEVQVSAQLVQGRITEWFPAPTFTKPLNPSGTASSAGDIPFWTGMLAPPADSSAAAAVPKLDGPLGAHYGHAREVPAAWYFRSFAPRSSPTGTVAPAEKFIFYRGAGEAMPPLQANAPEAHRLKLMRFDSAGTTYSVGPFSPASPSAGNAPLAAFALQVEKDRARWARMPDLAPRGRDATSPATVSEMRLDGEALPVAEAAKQLGEAMAKELVAAGLSADEAKAMIATWSDAWFRESGSRMFVLLPRNWVDTVLPLHIQPKPQKLMRVFVGRFETFTPEQEQTLLTLVQSASPIDSGTAAKFRDLRLGRFANAAVERVKAMMEFQFAQLQQASLQPATAAR
jgi:hypothetical protein